MRARLLIGLSVVVVLLLGAATALAFWGDGPTHRSGIVSIDLTTLRPGSAQAVAVELPGKRHRRTRIFLARDDANRVHRVLGVSTHLGCRLLLPGDPGYGDVVTAKPPVVFEDPCGGSAFALNGDCIAGPCPRGLDRYRVKVQDDTAQVDLNTLVTGAPRGS